MSQINPYIGSILQTPAAQRQAAAERDKQMQSSSTAAKNAWLAEDRVELTVESEEAADRAGDQKQQQQQSRKQQKKHDQDAHADDEDRLDIRA